MTGVSFNGKKLLLVEDNAVIALEAQLLLEDAGAIVTTASTVREALDLIAQDQPDLAILDVNLVGENSMPVAHKLRELGIEFIFTTGYGEGAALPPELADAPVVAKPCKGPKLLAALAEAAGSKIARA
jgi:CheY-like chemotaxis protein